MKKESDKKPNLIADIEFDAKKEQAKKDFNLACDLYRSYVGKAETMEERMRRIQKFRGG